jgi:hypothetical protein
LAKGVCEHRSWVCVSCFQRNKFSYGWSSLCIQLRSLFYGDSYECDEFCFLYGFRGSIFVVGTITVTAAQSLCRSPRLASRRHLMLMLNSAEALASGRLLYFAGNKGLDPDSE